MNLFINLAGKPTIYAQLLQSAYLKNKFRIQQMIILAVRSQIPP